MFGKKFSVKIKSVLILVTISLIVFQFLIINDNSSMIVTGTTTGKVVAFLETNTPMTSVNSSNLCLGPPGGYDSFVEQLENNSYVIETIDEGEKINQATLQNYDIIVILTSFVPYTVIEINEIYTWINNGGSLLLATDYDVYGAAVEDLLNNFEYDCPYRDGLEDSDDTVGTPLQFYIDIDNIVAHDITTDVNRIEIYAGTGFIGTPTGALNLIDTDDNDTTTWETGGLANNITILSAIVGGNAGNGKLVTITDTNIWNSDYDTDGDGDNNFFDSDNEKLALNIITWLTNEPIVTSTPSTITPLFSVDFFSIITLLTFTSIVIIKRKRK